jgi:methylated-DNA-[protein]-cysteine S-methyltransferase
MKFSEKVYSFCAKIPLGKVSTYKEIGKAMKTKAYRAIGQSLRCNPYAPKVPCHRVVAHDGSLGGFNGKMNSKKKITLLKKEGVIVEKGKIKNFEAKLFKF